MRASLAATVSVPPRAIEKNFIPWCLRGLGAVSGKNHPLGGESALSVVIGVTAATLAPAGPGHVRMWGPNVLKADYREVDSLLCHADDFRPDYPGGERRGRQEQGPIRSTRRAVHRQGRGAGIPPPRRMAVQEQRRFLTRAQRGPGEPVAANQPATLSPEVDRRGDETERKPAANLRRRVWRHEPV